MKLCCVFNYNPLYRWPIFHALDEVFGCDFYFGDTVFQKIEQFDARQLKGFQGFIRARKLGKTGFVLHRNIKKIFSRKYTHYLITGESGGIVNWLIQIYAKLTNKKVFLWCHGIHAPIQLKKTRLIYKLFFTHVDGIFLYSSYSIPFMVALGCKKERLFIIHNSLDTKIQTKLFEKPPVSNIYYSHFQNKQPIAIYIGRIQKRKKIDQLLKAIALCKKKGEIINVVIVGSIEDDDKLCELPCQLDIADQVWLYGPCYNEILLAELLFNANVSVCPAAIGLSCIHSLSYGTPVITNDDFENQMPEHEAIINRETGSFFQKDNIENLSDQILYWTKKSIPEREMIRNQARQTILEEWSVDYQINMFTSVIKKL
jgi:glycosyltransferase involved in cell wall biosynthesis